MMFRIFKSHGHPKAKTTNNQGGANNEKPKITKISFYTKVAEIVVVTLAQIHHG